MTSSGSRSAVSASPQRDGCLSGRLTNGQACEASPRSFCNVDSGSVTVEHNLTVLPGGTLNAQFGGTDTAPSDVTVGGNLDVQTNGVLVLGCEPVHFTCQNDPDPSTGGTFSNSASVGGNLTAEDALAVVVHVTAIGRNVTMSGGGGGVTCNAFLPVLLSPPYGDFEDNTIGGNLTIAEWHSCWLGALRDTIRGNVDWHSNVTADPDGNEIATNSIGRNLNCSGDTPTHKSETPGAA